MQFRRIITVWLLFLILAPASASYALKSDPLPTSQNTPANLRTQQLENRLMEIRKIDKTQLTAVEKKRLRKEVREIRREHSNGIYLSVGAVIIIILLLILLL